MAMPQTSNLLPDALMSNLQAALNMEDAAAFIDRFSMYLSCDNEVFVVSLDNVWQCIGFTLKEDCQSLLVNNFIAGPDYNTVPSNDIMMTKSVFQELCTLAANDMARRVCRSCEKMQSVMLQHWVKLAGSPNLMTDNALTLLDTRMALALTQEKELVEVRSKHRNGPGEIYIAQMYQSIILNDSVYKIGRAYDAGIRVKGYPKGSVLICRLAVSRMEDAENAMKHLCCHDVVQRRDYGSEYFEGTVDMMIKKLLIAAAPYSHARAPSPIAERVPAVVNQLHRFLMMTDNERGCSITHVKGNVTNMIDFKAFYKAKMERTLTFADPDIFKLFNMRLSRGRVHVCSACKQESRKRGGLCCAEYDHDTRGKMVVIYDTRMTSVPTS